MIFVQGHLVLNVRTHPHTIAGDPGTDRRILIKSEKVCQE